VLLEMSVAVCKVYGKVKEKYLKTTYRCAGILLNVNAILDLNYN
jgi:hypothetical protein